MKKSVSDVLVSIIIPCFNSENTIIKTIQSCQQQSHKKIEIIIVDDGSSDKTAERIKRFQDQRIALIQQKNCGSSAARNAGLKKAKGEYIQYLDSDDLLGKRKIEGNLLKLFPLKSKMAISLSDTVFFNDGENPKKGLRHCSWPLVSHPDPIEWLIELLGPEEGGMVQTSAWLTPRSIIDKIGLWNEKIQLNDDGEYFSRAVLKSDGIYKADVGETYYRKYLSQQSLSGQKEPKYLEGGLLAIDLIAKNIFRKTKSEKAKKAVARVYKEFAFRYYPNSPKLVDLAIQKATRLGYGKIKPCFGTPLGTTVSFFLGWKIAKKVQAFIYKIKKK